MATKTLNTRISLKTDTTANWAASTLVLLKGEAALEITESGDYKIKFGDGVKTFKELTYATMTPAEINTLITDGAVQSVSLATGTNNGTVKLTVDGKTTDNIAVKGLGSAAYTNTSNYATAAQGTLATNAVRKVATGSKNGTISVTTGTGAATDVAIKGLGSAAYTASNAYATAAQGTKADNAMPKAGGTFTGAVTLNADPTANLHPATKQYVDSKISSSIAASDAMVFKGTIGTNGTSTTLPTSAVAGDTYKVITQITIPANNSYTAADVTAKIGDLVVAMAKDPKWLVVPSGDEAVTTVNYSTTTTNLTTSAKTGSITLGEAATKQIDSSITKGSTSTNLATSKAVVDYMTWGNVQGKPSTFTPSTHTHTKDQVGLGNVDNTADANKSVKYAGSAGTATNITSQGAATANEERHIWFSASVETQRAHNDSLKYNPSTNTISANISGTSAAANSVDWTNVKNRPSTYAPSSHNHTIAQVTNLQSTLDGKAGILTLTNQDLNTVNATGFYTAAGGNTCANKPDGIDNFGLIVIHNASGAYYTQIFFANDKSYRRYCTNGTWSAWKEDKLTDTNTWRGIQNNLTSDSTDQSLSAAQGKVLKGLVDGKAAASHTHTIANVTGLQSALDSKASSGHTHTNFTQETHFSTGTYSDPATNVMCAVKVSGNLAASVIYEGGTTLANKYQPKGSYAAASHTHTIGQITDLQSKLDGKSNNGHTHDDRYYTESEMNVKLAEKANASHGHNNISCYGTNTINTVANDTTANWAGKANSVHFYNTKDLLNGQPSQYGFLFNMASGASEIHQIWAEHGGSLYHRYGNNNSDGTSNIEKTWRKILDSSNYTGYTVTKTGGGASGTWGISITGNAATASKCTGNAATATTAETAKACTGNAATATKLATARKIGNASFDGSADITLASIGAAASNHTHSYAGSSSVGGAANSAVKLSTARAFSITGGVTATAVNFDGTGNVTLNATVASVSTDVLFNGSNTLILDCGNA